MTRKSSIVWLVTTSMALPAVAHAQTGQGSDPRVRVPSRVVIQQQQRERQRAQRREEVTEKINRSFKIGGSGELVVSNLAGDITVTRGSGNEVTIDVTKIARGHSADEAKEMLPLVSVDFIERGNRIEARTQYPRWQDERRDEQRRNVNVSVVYNISAPAGTHVIAKSLSGSISVTDIKGEVAAVSLSGNVAIANAERVSSAKSTSGHVELTNVNNGDLPLEANSISGNVIVKQAKAPRMELGTVSGDLLLSEVQSPRIEAQSLSGTVEFASPFTKGGRYDFTSHSGTVRIVVVGNVGFEIDANTFSGTIQSDPSLNLKKQEEETGRPGRRQRTLQAVYGDGSAAVDVTTFSGSVVVTRK